MQNFEYLMMFIIYIFLVVAGVVIFSLGAVLTVLGLSVAAVVYFPCIILEKIFNK